MRDTYISSAIDMLERKQISSGLLRSYEVKNLEHGWTLKGISEEYQGVDKVTLARFEVGLSLTFWSLILGFFGSAFIVSKGYMSFRQVQILAEGFVALTTVWIIVAGLRAEKTRRILARCEPVLEEFGQAAEGLHHPLGMSVEQFSDESVRQHFVLHAKRILEAQEKFRRVRFDEKKLASDVCEANHQVRDYENKFERAVRGAAKFGLKFKNSELFAAAERQLQKA